MANTVKLGYIAAIAVAVGATYLFGKCQGKTNAENAAAFARAEATLAAETGFQEMQRKLNAIASANADSAQLWKQRALARRPDDGRLNEALTAAKTVNDSNKVLIEQNEELRSEISDWKIAFAYLEHARLADSTRADRAEARVVDLGRNLAAILDVADCHILGARFLPRCPSRTVSFVLGAVATTIVAVAVR
jgi:hypothetical protein